LLSFSTALAYTRQSLVNSEIEEITNKIVILGNIRAQLEQDLLKIQEDELELDDEREPTPSPYCYFWVLTWK